METNLENRLISLKQLIQQLPVSDRKVLLKWLIELLQQDPPSIPKQSQKIDFETVDQICREIRLLPILDSRSSDEIIGYNQFGGLD